MENEKTKRKRRRIVNEEWTVRSSGTERQEVRGSSGSSGGVTLRTTWELLLPIWDIEDRPEAMQHMETVNAMSLDNVFAYKQHYEQQTKKEGKGDSAFGKDKKLPGKKFEEEEDNCMDKLHTVRFERGPMAEEDTYWSRVPLKRKDTYRHLPLEQDGADGQVNENVITRAHDRSLPLRLRMFSKSNFAKKGFSTGTETREPASDWEAPKAVLCIQEALRNFSDVYRKLWPLDNTPGRLERVLIHYDYGARLGGDLRDRCKIIEEFSVHPTPTVYIRPQSVYIRPQFSVHPTPTGRGSTLLDKPVYTVCLFTFFSQYFVFITTLYTTGPHVVGQSIHCCRPVSGWRLSVFGSHSCYKVRFS